MPRFIYFIPICIFIYLLSACGGGSVEDDCNEFVGPVKQDTVLPVEYCQHPQTQE